MKTKIVALRPMRYGTRRLIAGDDFEAKPRDADLLIRLKRAKAWERPKADVPPIPAKLKAAVAPAAPVTAVAPEVIQPEQPDERAALRAEYQAKFDKKPFHGWDVETLKAKIAEGTPES